MARVCAFLYGLVAYLLAVVTLTYAIGFLGNFVVPKSVDTGTPGPVGVAVLVNVLLLAAFAVPHSIMARPWFKAWWTRFVPKPIERSTFVLQAGLLLALVYWQWRPMPAAVWHIEEPAIRAVLIGLSLAGWAVLFYSSFLIDHFDLFGLRQVTLYLLDRPYRHRPFTQRSLYKWVRHPLMVGLLVGIWSTPTMSQGHLLFALMATGYILVGIALEERDLARHLGDDYRRYRQDVPMLLPLPRRHRGEAETETSRNRGPGRAAGVSPPLT